MRICNMRMEDMVEGLNRHIEGQRVIRNIITHGHLVFQLSITPHETIKAYKKYEAVVWFVKDKAKHRVVTATQTAKVIEGEDKHILRVLNIELSKTLFSFIGTEIYNQIIEGTYDGNTNE